MGFFSWKTCDKDESIMNRHSGTFINKPVYLLEPNGLEPISETCYDGYGVFGGVDAYEWLALRNTRQPFQRDVNSQMRRKIGILLESGGILLKENAFIDQQGFYHVYKPNLQLLPYLLGPVESDKIKPFRYYDELVVVDGIEATIVEHKANNRLVWVIDEDLAFPLKFSFNKNARYEDYPASKRCQHQGFFL